MNIPNIELEDQKRLYDLERVAEQGEHNMLS